MGRPSRRSRFTLPTADEIAKYEETEDNRDGPSIDREHPKQRPFKFDVSSAVTSLWNLRCVQVFVDNYSQISGALSTDREEIRKAITTHHKALRLQWFHLAENLPDTVKEKMALTTIRQERYSRRKEVSSPFST